MLVFGGRTGRSASHLRATVHSHPGTLHPLLSARPPTATRTRGRPGADIDLSQVDGEEERGGGEREGLVDAIWWMDVRCFFFLSHDASV